MKIQGIYKIRNILNSKIYIGRSLNIEKRFREHKHAEKAKVPHPYPIARAINKYGIDNFEFMIIEVVTDYLKLDGRELYWIKYYKSNDPSYGYNIRVDCRTNKGFKHSKETKDKLSEITKEQWKNQEFRKIVSESAKKRFKNPEFRDKMLKAAKAKPSYGNTGHKHSEETKKKMSNKKKGKPIWNKGKKMSDEYRQKCSDGNKKSMTKERREKISKSRKGKKFSEETKQKMKEARKLFDTEEYRNKISESMKKVWINRKNKNNLDLLDQDNRDSNISNVLQEQFSSQHLLN